jgi:hypothetical protein
MNLLKYILQSILFGLIIISCDKNDVTKNESNELFVSLRMEVHVVDSVYNLYSRPLTKVYLHSYKLTGGSNISDESFSDTTTCKNGWAVKELNYVLNNVDEKIFLGATTKSIPQIKFNYTEVTYKELKNIADEKDSVRFVKTFTIYE